MSFENPTDEALRELLTESRVIAMVGASSDPERPSHGVMQRLLAAGYRVIPVNPNEREVLGQRAYASLDELGTAVDIVNVFRRAQYTPSVARQAVAIGAKALWLQEGIVNEQAAAIAKAGNLQVVMDRCIAVDYSVLGVAPKR